MKSFTFLLLLIFSVTAFAAEKPLQLIYASSMQHTKYGMSQQDVKFRMLVKKSQDQKKVQVTLKNVQFEDLIIEAKKVDDLKDNPDFELWEAQTHFNSTRDPLIRSIDFFATLKFDRNSEVYEDRNSTYHLEPDDGPMLVNHAVMLNGLYQFSSEVNEDLNELLIYGSVDVMNLDYDKIVKIIYSLDDWKTSNVIFANFNFTYTIGYAYFYCPNDHGVERWSFRVELGPNSKYVPGSSQVMKYYVEYETNGQIFYDNNFGPKGYYEIELK